MEHGTYEVVALEPLGSPSPGTVWATGLRLVLVESEDAGSWYGRPVRDTTRRLPLIRYPKFTWEVAPTDRKSDT